MSETKTGQRSPELQRFQSEHRLLRIGKPNPRFYGSATHRTLQRLVLPWKSLPVAQDLRTIESTIPRNLFADDELWPRSQTDEKLLADILREPIFRRLALCYQLGMTSIGPHVSASHNRLSHAIGTFDIARAMIEAAKPIAVPQSAKEAALLAILVQQAAAPPLAHALDLTKDVLMPNSEQGQRAVRQSKLQKAYYQDLMTRWRLHDCGHPLLAAIERILSSRGDETRAWFTWITSPESLAAKDQQRAESRFLREIVEARRGRIDADRLDFLRRDSLMLGELDTQSIVRCLVESCSCSTSGDLEFDRPRFDAAVQTWAPTLHRILTPEAAIDALVRHRKTLYTSYYEVDTKLAYDEMIAHAVRNFLCASGVEALRTSPADQNLWQEVQADLLLLADTQLIDFLIHGGDAPSARLAIDAVSGRSHVSIRTPNLAKKVMSTDKDVKSAFDAGLAEAVESFKTLQAQLQVARKLDGQERTSLTSAEKLTLGKRVMLGIASPEMRIELLARLCPDMMPTKYAIEQRMWALMLEADSARVVALWDQYLQQRFGAADSSMWNDPRPQQFQPSATQVDGDLSKELGSLKRDSLLFVGLPFYSARQVENTRGGYESDAKVTLFIPPEFIPGEVELVAILDQAIQDTSGWLVDELSRRAEA